VFLELTRHGRLMYAIGSNERAAALAGTNVHRYKITAYMISGVLPPSAASCWRLGLGGATSQSGNNLLLDSVAAALIGFAVLGAAKPNAFGTAIGALFVGILLQGLTMMNAPYYTQDFVKGGVLVVALVFTFALSARKRGGAIKQRFCGGQKRSELEKGETPMIGTKRTFMKMLAGALGVASPAWGALGAALAQDMPAPFDNPGDVQIALVRYLSTGDFFQAYLAGVEASPKRSASIFASSTAGRTPRLQADMVDQAIALGRGRHHHPARPDRVDAARPPSAPSMPASRSWPST
jgi:hypothetical protein